MIKKFLEEVKGISFVDIGSSGHLDRKWDALRSHINLIGFDPNVEECSRMNQKSTNFKSAKYLPYAIAGERKQHTLYKTRSPGCFSLLQPNADWLSRFAFSDLFEVISHDIVQTVRLSDVAEIQAGNIDVLKVDTQGLELPILKNSGNILDSVFYVETETGFVNNYIDETTYADLDCFMRKQGFLLFDINTSHRISRNNVFRNYKTGAEQLMWCESVWLKDYISHPERLKSTNDDSSRDRILKAMILCAFQGCIDYGYEIACLGVELNLVSKGELEQLASLESWEINPDRMLTPRKTFYGDVINFALRLLPKSTRVSIRDQASRAVHQKHIFKL